MSNLKGGKLGTINKDDDDDDDDDDEVMRFECKRAKILYKLI